MRPQLRRGLTVIATVCLIGLAAWLLLTHWLPVSVGGGSMYPALRPGDLAVVARTGHAGAGRIALLDTARHGRVLHRVVSVGVDGAVHTRGDANSVDDLDAVPATSVIGPVVLVAPLGRVLERWRAVAACVTMAAQQNSSKR